MAPTKKEILAASAGWVAVILNVLPDLDSENLNQRRWKAHWIISALETTFFTPGAIPRQGAITEEMNNQLVGPGGLVALAEETAIEAGLTVKKACLAEQVSRRPRKPSGERRGMGATASLLQRERGVRNFHQLSREMDPGKRFEDL